MKLNISSIKIKKLINFFRSKWRPNYLKYGQFWVQNIKTNAITNRIDFFEQITKNKKVLHFGCTDWPIFNPSYNLHIKLSKSSKEIHGFDIDEEGINNLKKYVDQKYFTDFNQIKGEKYDICLIPETIEHVDNVESFLRDLSSINADVFFITAPNCFSKEHIKRNFYGKNYFKEVVHPDHNCWYSPYTLKNQIEKYSDLKVLKIFLLEGDKMVCCEAVKKQNEDNLEIN